jgi:Sap, sulfolipid-1-addressing protein
VTIEIILLALVSTVRPTSLAAVDALLSTVAPRRLMIVYTAAGLTFTIAVGLLIIGAFQGVDINSGTDRTKGIAEIASGIVALAFALGVLTGRIGGAHAEDAPKAGGRWDKLREHRLTLRTAALAGPATHIPGLFYLMALNVIVAHQPKVSGGVIEVLIYNVIWFTIPLVALVVCVEKPAIAREAVGAIDAWTKRHARTIVLAVSFGVGAALVVRGALTV